MSEAVDNAEVMLTCISLSYKESASKDPRSSALHVCHLRCLSCVPACLRLQAGATVRAPVSSRDDTFDDGEELPPNRLV
eukprot:COSAG02_NODE_1328_length_13219_cov_45.612652_6_plen_79_part_00